MYIGQTIELLGEGCEYFMASLVEYVLEPKDWSTIALEAKFYNIFPEELPRIPPRREVEFEINSALDMTPISKVPHRWNQHSLRT